MVLDCLRMEVQTGRKNHFKEMEPVGVKGYFDMKVRWLQG